jgi:TfoX/Sxy family transcriptional regulator of competence genes
MSFDGRSASGLIQSAIKGIIRGMASDLDYVEYVADQIKTGGTVTYKKMFGEYLIYLNNKPAVLVCDNTAFVKMLDCIKPLMEDAETGFPYKGAKEHYIVNVDNREHFTEVATVLEKNLPTPKKKKKRA